MNLKSHHRRERVIRTFRRDTVGLNSPGGVFDYPDPEVAAQRIEDAVMATRQGLNVGTACRMTQALWECDD